MEPAQSKWSSPIVLFLRLNGYWWLCIDYPRLIGIMIQHTYVIPKTNDCANYLGESTWFMTLGANSEHWQIQFPRKTETKPRLRIIQVIIGFDACRSASLTHRHFSAYSGYPTMWIQLVNVPYIFGRRDSVLYLARRSS